MASKSKFSMEDHQAWLTTATRLYRLTKKRSPYIREYIQDPTDEWFVYVITIRKKSGVWEDSSMIIQKDVNTWLSYDKSNGWELETLN